MYLGIVVLRVTIPVHVYVHLLHLSLATHFASRASDEFTINSAAVTSLYFILSHKLLYALQEMSMNVHSLIHLSDDVRNHDPLATFIKKFLSESYLKSSL